MASSRLVKAFSTSVSTNLKTASSITFYMSEEEEKKLKADKLLLSIQELMRMHLNWYIEQQLQKGPLSREDLLNKTFRIQKSAIKDFLKEDLRSAYSDDAKDPQRNLSQQIDKAVIRLQGLRVVVNNIDGTQSDKYTQFYSSVTIPDQYADYFDFSLSELAVDLWASQLEGNRRTIVVTSLADLTPTEFQLYELVYNIYLDNKLEIERDDFSFSVPVQLLANIFNPAKMSDDSWQFKEIKKNHLDRASKKIASVTGLSFEISKRRGRGPEVAVIGNIKKDPNIMPADYEVKKEAPSLLMIRADQRDYEIAFAKFTGLAEAYGFSTSEIEELANITGSDSEKLKMGHNMYATICGSDSNIKELDYLRRIFART